jgi:hypothetical protein
VVRIFSAGDQGATAGFDAASWQHSQTAKGEKTSPLQLDSVDTDLFIPVFLRKDIADGL